MVPSGVVPPQSTSMVSLPTLNDVSPVTVKVSWWAV